MCAYFSYRFYTSSCNSVFRDSFAKRNNFKYIPRILPAYFTAVGTQSSASTIPINLKCAHNCDMSEGVANFCIPLCATIHLAGDTICLVLGTMGIMMAMGMDVSLTLFTP